MPHCAAVRTCLQLLTHISGSVSQLALPLFLFLFFPSLSLSLWARSQLGKHLTTGAHMNAQHSGSGSKRMPQWDTHPHTHRSVNLFLICCKLMELTSSGLCCRHEGIWDCRCRLDWDHSYFDTNMCMCMLYEYISVFLAISLVLFAWLHTQAIYLSLDKRKLFTNKTFAAA